MQVVQLAMKGILSSGKQKNGFGFSFVESAKHLLGFGLS